jgi:heme exporter protein D
MMNHAAFVTAAFLVTAIGTVALLAHSWLSMSRSEALARDLQDRR